jgi:hypothetical protein
VRRAQSGETALATRTRSLFWNVPLRSGSALSLSTDRRRAIRLEQPPFFPYAFSVSCYLHSPVFGFSRFSA